MPECTARPDVGRDTALDLTGPAWNRLTRLKGKDEVFARDLHAREAWATLTSVLGDDGAYDFAGRVGVMWVRPDAFAAGTARQVLTAAKKAAFRPLAARPVRVDRCGVRALWAYMCRWATVERLRLLDALVALGPGLLVLWADETGEPTSVRLSAVKGSNAPHRRRTGTSLRDVAGAPNRLLTMVHTADEPADVIRELGVFCPWPERAALVTEAARTLADGAPCPLEETVVAVESELPPLGVPEPCTAPALDGLTDGPLAQRWAALWAASHQWPLLTRAPGPAAWPEQEARSPWR
ncbi:hypothetical protein [Streptomyces sp. NPDC051173]|uniref:hypothetical protein n=1 Tax=Streptomyces sp. NPDC051173 TaxID=3155164 RepID=UPI0034508FED